MLGETLTFIGQHDLYHYADSVNSALYVFPMDIKIKITGIYNTCIYSTCTNVSVSPAHLKQAGPPGPPGLTFGIIRYTSKKRVKFDNHVHRSIIKCS